MFSITIDGETVHKDGPIEIRDQVTGVVTKIEYSGNDDLLDELQITTEFADRILSQTQVTVGAQAVSVRVADDVHVMNHNLTDTIREPRK